MLNKVYNLMWQIMGISRVLCLACHMFVKLTNKLGHMVLCASTINLDKNLFEG